MFNQFGDIICKVGCTFNRFKFTPNKCKSLTTTWIKLDGTTEEFENVDSAIKKISEYEPKLQISIDLMTFGRHDYRLYDFRTIGYIIQELETDKFTWHNPQVIAVM